MEEEFKGTMRELVITPVLNGFIIRAGCQQLVYQDVKDLAADLIAYQKNPQEFEKQIIARAVNSAMGPIPQPVEPIYRDEPNCEQPPRYNNIGLQQGRGR